MVVFKEKGKVKGAATGLAIGFNKGYCSLHERSLFFFSYHVLYHGAWSPKSFTTGYGEGRGDL